MSESTLGGSDQCFAERCFCESIVKRDAATEALQLTGCDGIQCHDEIVEATRPGKSDGVSGVENGRPTLYFIARRAAGNKRQILLGGDAGPTSEQAIKVKFRQPCVCGNRGEAGLITKVLVDVTNRPGNTGEVAAIDEAVVYEAVMRGFHDGHPSDTGRGNR